MQGRKIRARGNEKGREFLDLVWRGEKKYLMI
jgi:hypothetical protein